MRVTDRAAIHQTECGHKSSRIDSTVGLGVLLTFAEIDRYQRHRNSPFSARKMRTRREFGDVAE